MSIALRVTAFPLKIPNEPKRTTGPIPFIQLAIEYLSVKACQLHAHFLTSCLTFLNLPDQGLFNEVLYIIGAELCNSVRQSMQ